MAPAAALIAAGVSGAQNCRRNPEARAARAVVVAQNVEGLTLDGLSVRWPETDAAGRMLTPPDWRHALRGANGMFAAYFERAAFNSDVLPPFALLWARGVRGAVVRAPRAAPSRPGVPRIDAPGCEVAEG